MTKIDAESIVELFETIKSNAKNSPFVSRASKFFNEAEAKGVSNIKLGFEAEEEDEEVSNPAKATATVVVNKLVKLFNKMVKSIADHAKAIKFNKDVAAAVKVEVDIRKDNNREKAEEMVKLNAECKKLK